MDRGRSIRAVTSQDDHAVRRLLGQAAFRHEHLDWIHALDLLDQEPFFLALSNGKCIACLACPPDVRGVAWLRLFLAADQAHADRLWLALWEPARRQLTEMGVTQAAALPVNSNLAPLLEGSGFRQADEVVFMVWEGPPQVVSPAAAQLRALRPQDIPAVTAVDHVSFAPLWQLSEQSLHRALEQSEVATVALAGGEVVGYQMCTASGLGAHLARLAVLPHLRRRGLARLLVADALRQLHRRGFDRATVNTQRSNLPSLALYERMGFRRSGQDYPVYTQELGAG